LWQAICSLLLAVKAGITHVVGYGLLSCAQIVRFLVELPTNRLKFGGKFKTDRDSGQAKAPLRLDAKFLSAMPICAYQQAPAVQDEHGRHSFGSLHLSRPGTLHEEHIGVY
jgi:hypothetical protein